MRCIVGFFGLTRSLRHTAASIRDGVFTPLRQSGFTIVSAAHFNLPEFIDNPRSQEHAIVPCRDDADLLDLDLRWIEPQTTASIATAFEIGRAFPDAFGDGYRSLANVCHQLHSLARLWTMLDLLDIAPGEPILLLRPDLLYVDALDPGIDLRPILDGVADLVVPRWQPWGGLNDRFAFCNRRGAEIYATRLAAFLDGCLALGGMHSERLLHLVATRGKLRVAYTDLRAVRVRANGRVAGNDAAMLRDWPAPSGSGGPPAASPAGPMLPSTPRETTMAMAVAMALRT